MTESATPPLTCREAIARIIDPEAWKLIDHWLTKNPRTRPDLMRRAEEQAAPALSKADAIIALHPFGELIEALSKSESLPSAHIEQHHFRRARAALLAVDRAVE